MDPNANLVELLRLANGLLDTDEPDPHDAHRMAELVTDLHAWLEAGGFLPDDWQRGQETTPDYCKPGFNDVFPSDEQPF